MAFRVCAAEIGPGRWPLGGMQHCREPEGHEGPHSQPLCLDADPGAEYECPHTCELRLGHEGPHMEIFGWGEGWGEFPPLVDLIRLAQAGAEALGTDNVDP